LLKRLRLEAGARLLAVRLYGFELVIFLRAQDLIAGHTPSAGSGTISGCDGFPAAKAGAAASMPVAKNAAAAIATIVFFMVLSPLLIDFAFLVLAKRR